MILINFTCVFHYIFQALRLFRLAAKLESKAAALKSEALQHLFIALAGSDCKELWTLLVHFFGKGTGFDPFEFLDGAPAIKRPLDLTDTDSEDEASETASSATLGSVSTTASLDAEASTSSALTPAPRPVLKAKHVLPDKFPAVEFTEGCVPSSMAEIHATGIPTGVACKRSGKTTARGASLYICPHTDCGATPYVGDLYGCSSHLRRVHYGTSIMCPYCPAQKYYRASGWKSHMSSKHATAPWFGASKPMQASLMLAAVQEEIDAPPSSQQPSVPEFRLPTQEEISTVPLNPSTVEVVPEESLPYTQDFEEEDVPPEQEQGLVTATEKEEEFVPRDSRTWEYGRNVQGTMQVRYLKCDDPSKELATVSTPQGMPTESGDTSDVPPAKKSKRDDGATSM